MDTAGDENFNVSLTNRDRLEIELVENIKANLQKLEALLDDVDCPIEYEDDVYRYYHHSWKVFGVQDCTEEIVNALKDLFPSRGLNPLFLEIIEEGTGKEFEKDTNENWSLITRPLLEAFFHAKYFLEMLCRYGKELSSDPAWLPTNRSSSRNLADILDSAMPSGWAAILCLYNI